MRLTQEQRREVQLAVAKYIEIARNRWNQSFAFPVVRFDLRGQRAGTARNSDWVIRVNEVLCAENYDHYIKQIIGHEVAHLIADSLYGNKIRPHGVEWQRVMNAFGLPADRCHEYDVSNSGARTVERGHAYSCNCKVRYLTSIRVNKMAKGAYYTCKDCGHVLKPGTQIGGSKRPSEMRQQTVTKSWNLYTQLGLRD